MPRKRGGETGGEGAAGGPLPPQPGTIITDAALTAKGAPERMNADGSPNVEYFRWCFKQVNDLSVRVALGITEMPKGYNLAQAKELLESEAKNVYGMDPKALADIRSDHEKVADAIRHLAENPDSALEMSEATLDGTITEMERQMDAADSFGREILGGTGTDYAKERADAKLLDAKKKWASRLRRIKSLRHRAREAFPGGFRGDYRCYAAMHPIRFMVYVGRSSIGADSTVFRIGRHHAEMAAELWQARNRLQFGHGQRTGVLDWYTIDCDGVMYVISPGHGKTAFVAHAITLILDQNPREKWMFGHAQAEKAEQNLAYVASNFDPNTANGRRNIALFNPPPIVKLNKNTMDLEDRAGETRRQPTVMAHGMTAKVSGSDTDGIWFDDPCDQELAEQETTRKRVFDRMNGTWRTRKRGKKAFEIISTTLWHHDDPNARWFKLISDGDINFLALKRGCGGPDEKFKPLWEAEYPASRLKQIYAQMRNPRLYAAAYQGNPQPEELRKIKKLAYYLPGSAEHARFMDNAIFHVSLDPTATNREKSDKAAFVYAGEGDIEERDGDTVSATRRLRFLDFRDFHANQTEGVNEVCGYVAVHMTHYVHAEVRSGFNATVEIFETRGLDVIPHDPKNRKKELRLMDIAPMLDDSLRERGFPGAVAEFPGKLMDDGSIGPDPDSPLVELERQILNFGVTPHDHGVDATTQLLKHLGPTLNVGDAAATTQLREAEKWHADPRISRMLAACQGTGRKKSAAQQDWDFLCRMRNN